MENFSKQLDKIEKMLQDQILQKKEILTLSEAAIYLNVSKSTLYKNTSSRILPHYCPTGKKLYFNRVELDKWIQTNKRKSSQEIETNAASFILKNSKS